MGCRTRRRYAVVIKAWLVMIRKGVVMIALVAFVSGGEGQYCRISGVECRTR